MSEKRLNGRKNFEYPISFEFSCMEAGKVLNVQKSGACVDISMSGVGLTTDHALVKGEVVRVYLPVDAVEASLPVYSEVMWSKPAKGYYRAGLRFLV